MRGQMCFVWLGAVWRGVADRKIAHKNKLSLEEKDMTTKEAIELEKKCEELINKSLSITNCTLSFTLSSRLRISTNTEYYILSKDLERIDYFNFVGFYEDFAETCDNILTVVKENIEDFKKLYWSYDHIKELEEEI